MTKRINWLEQANELGFKVDKIPELLFTPNLKKPKKKDDVCIDIFAGCGGASLGLTQAGIHPALAIDNEKWAMLTYMANLGRKPSKPVCFMHQDIKKINGKQIIKLLSKMGYEPKVTYIWGSPPCQDFSTANMKNRKSRPVTFDQGTRYCILEFVRLIRELKPLCFFMENVPGLVQGKLKILFDVFLAKLKRIGYQVTWDILNAADFGVPQNRKRVIAIGIHGRQYNERKAQQLLQSLYPGCTVTPYKVGKK